MIDGMSSNFPTQEFGTGQKAGYEFLLLLRDEFRSVPDSAGSLSADWISTAWNEDGDQWLVRKMEINGKATLPLPELDNRSKE